MPNLNDAVHQGGNIISGTVNFGLAGCNISNSHISLGIHQENVSDRKRSCLRILRVCHLKDERDTIKHQVSPGFQPEVSNWIRTNHEFNSWSMDDQSSDLLWIRGEAYSGKTMLTIYISTLLEQRFSNSDRHLVVYLFCGHLRPKDRTAHAVLHTLLCELCDKWANVYEQHLDPVFQGGIDRLSASTDQALFALRRILADVIKSKPGKTIWFVIDGLDQLATNEQQLRILVGQLTTFFRENVATLEEDQHTEIGKHKDSTAALKIVMLSRERPLTNLTQDLVGFARIELDIFSNDPYRQAYKPFIVALMDESAVFSGLAPETRKAILQAISMRNDASFLPINSLLTWAGKEIWRNTDNISLFPSRSDDVYLLALDDIPHHKRHATAALMRWGLIAQQPMSVAEMSDGLINIAGPSKRETFCRPAMLELLKFCTPFLTLFNDRIYVRHQSARDFLTSNHWHAARTHLNMFQFEESKLHDELAKACILYVAKPANLPAEIDVARLSPDYKWAQHLATHPFLLYAVWYWPEHVRNAGFGPRHFDIAFFGHRSQQLQRWWMSYSRSFEATMAVWAALREQSIEHIAARFGLIGLLQNTEIEGSLRPTANKYDRSGQRPLDLAIEGRHVRVVKYLLQRQIPVANHNGDISVLHKAAYNGDLEMVQMIIDTLDLDIDFPCSSMSAAKMFFSHLRYPAALFDRYPDCDDSPRWQFAQRYGLGNDLRAFHLAAFGGQESVLRYCICKGADICAATSVGLNALHFAAAAGHVHIIRLLRTTGHSDRLVNAKNHEHLTPLHYAVISKTSEAAELLLTMSASVNAPSLKQKPPLLYGIIKNPHIDPFIVFALIKGGADVNCVDHKGRTPLTVAYTCRKLDLIKLLVGAGAKVDYVEPGIKGNLTIYDRAVRSGQSKILTSLQQGVRPIEALWEELFDFVDDNAADVPGKGGSQEKKKEEEEEKLTSSVISENRDDPPPAYSESFPQAISEHLDTTIDQTMTRANIWDISALFYNKIVPDYEQLTLLASEQDGARTAQHDALTRLILCDIIEPLNTLNQPDGYAAKLVKEEIIGKCECMLDSLEETVQSIKGQDRYFDQTGPRSQSHAVSGQSAKPSYATTNCSSTSDVTLEPLDSTSGDTNRATEGVPPPLAPRRQPSS